MRKAITMMLLAVVGNSAIAEWIKVGENDTRDFSYYVENNVYGPHQWVLFDYPQPIQFSKGFAQSIKFEYNFDCQTPGVRRLRASAYEENMAHGKVISTLANMEENWETVNRGSRTINNKLWELACLPR